jgi:hypothetical protein
MIADLKKNPLTTFLIAFVGLVAIIGGVVVIVHPETLNFERYLNDLEKFALALGVVGVGKGIASSGRKH